MDEKISTWKGRKLTADNFSKEELIAIIQQIGCELESTRRSHATSIEMQSMFRNRRTSTPTGSKAMSPPHPPCKHGKRHDEECIDCLIFWSEDCIKSARESIERHERKIVELRARIAPRSPGAKP